MPKEGQGAASSADRNKATQKCTTVGVANAATASDDCCEGFSAIIAMATNCSPVSAAADEPRMTKKLSHLARSWCVSSCTSEVPFVRRTNRETGACARSPDGHRQRTSTTQATWPRPTARTCAALHDESHVVQRRDVARRIAIDRDHVGQQAALDRTDARVHVEDARGDRGRALQRVHGRHAVVHQHLDLACVVAMREDADVAAADDRHTGVERRLEARALPRDAGRLGIHTLLPAAILRRRVAGRERRAQGDAVFLHQLKDLRRAAVAVLDGLDAAEDRAPHPLGRARVRRHRPVAALCRLDDGLAIR